MPAPLQLRLMEDKEEASMVCSRKARNLSGWQKASADPSKLLGSRILRFCFSLVILSVVRRSLGLHPPPFLIQATQRQLRFRA